MSCSRGLHSAPLRAKGGSTAILRSGKSLKVKQRQDGHGQLRLDAFPQGSLW